MAETTGIAWTKSTFNPWIGCTEVGPGCDPCYAREEDKRRRWGGATHWGPGVPRHRTTKVYWRQPFAWDRLAAQGITFAGRPGFWPVFGGSLMDPFDNDVPPVWRADYWDVIKATPHLTWQLVSKRIGNAPDMLPKDWGERGYPNVWLISSICNQKEADRDIPKLLRIPAKLHGISYEPALEAVDFRPWICSYGCPCGWGGQPLSYCNECGWRGGTAFYGEPCPGCKKTLEDYNACPKCDAHDGDGGDFGPNSTFLKWIIVGGESKQGGMQARPFDLNWARKTAADCRDSRVPCFVKQFGSNPVDSALVVEGDSPSVRTKQRAGADPREWPADLRVQEFPA